MKPLPYFIYTIAVIFVAVGASAAQQQTEDKSDKEATEDASKAEQESKTEPTDQEQNEEPVPEQEKQAAEPESDTPDESDAEASDQADSMIQDARQYRLSAAVDSKKFKEISTEDAPEKILSAFPAYSGPRTSESPVFVLLDLSPTEIQKPSGARPLAVSIARDLTSSDGLFLPLNLAVEVSPYWIDSHSGVDWKEYTDSGIEQLYQNLSLSVGASTFFGMTQSGEDVDLTSVAFGIRTGIDGRSYDCEQLEPVFYRYNDEQSREKLRAMDAAMFDGAQLDSFEDVDADFKKKWLKDEANAEAIRKATDQCTRKRDWAVDAAYATSFIVPDRTTKESDLSAMAGWLTFGILGDTVSLVPMTRLRSDLLYMNNSRTMIDLGAQFIVAAKSFAFSAEFIYRNVFDKPDEDMIFYMFDEPEKHNKSSFYRTGLGIDAALSSDIWLSLSFGKNYADLYPEEDLYVKTSLRFDLGERSLGIDPESVGIEYRD